MNTRNWRKSSHSSGGTSGECVEVAHLAVDCTGVRDSMDPEGGILRLPGRQFTELIMRIKHGCFDRPA